MSLAIVVHQTGAAEVMQMETHTPGAPGPGQVKLRQHAIGLNFIDIYQREGRYKLPLPFVPGNEAAGEIIALGEGVKGWKVGDRVAYAGEIGAYAQERLIGVEKLVAIPDDLPYADAASIMLKGLTAQFLLRQTYRVVAGDWILVHAAAGGVGQILCQWGRDLGARIIATASSPEKLRLAEQAGAGFLIDYSRQDFAAEVKRITEGHLCHVVYDGVGKATFLGSLNCLRPRGMMVTYGAASGAIEPFDPIILMQKGSLYLTRPSLNIYAADPVERAKMAAELFEAIRRGAVKPPLSHHYALKDAVQAHNDLEMRRTNGSCILLP